MKYKFFLVFLCLSVLPNHALFSQFFSLKTNGLDTVVSYIDTFKYERKERPRYRLIGTAIAYIKYRDFATSPLFYSGFGFKGEYGFLQQDSYKESLFSFNLQFGSTKNQFNNTLSTSTFLPFEFYYHKLFKLKNIHLNESYNLKFGGAFISTTNLRVNPDLLNNAFGFENITNLMFASKITRDISRTKAKELKFLWFFKKNYLPQKRELSYQLNVGLLNFNYRPGYAYNYLPKIEGTTANGLSNYKFSMNGYRLQAMLHFITYNENGNARRLSYIWDMYHAPGKYEAFQFAGHYIQFTQVIAKKQKSKKLK